MHVRGSAAILLLLLAGCGKSEPETPEAAVQQGIDRSVADVRAAEAAAAAPVVQSKSVGELTAKPAPEKAAETGNAEAADAEG
jgi:predicted outer membrane protein